MIVINEHFIESIKINKVRHLENIEISLSEEERKHLIFTGKNGSGKTTILNCIESYLKSIENNEFDSIKTYKKNLIDSKKRLDSLNKILNKSEDELIQIERYKQRIKDYTDQIQTYGNGIELELNTIIDLASKHKNGELILAFFKANRVTKVTLPRTIEKIQLKNNYSFNDNPSVQFVKYLIDLKTQQSFAKNEGDNEVVEKISKWFDNFESALRSIFEDETLEIKFNYRNYDFKIIQKGREPFGFDVLSDGYSSILNIVMDLILRMESKKGYYSGIDVKNYIYDIEGIVLIDEVETHLHMGIQKKIMPFLIKLFPRIQFIISTHSPFILNSIDNAIIYDLENRIKVEDLSKYSYEGIVEGYFKINQYSQEIREEIREYELLVNKDQLTEDERAKRSELRIKLKNISADLASDLRLKFEELELKRKKQND